MYDGVQVVEKVSTFPSTTSNSSGWRWSVARGSRGPRRTSRSGPPIAMITVSPSMVCRRTHGSTAP